MRRIILDTDLAMGVAGRNVDDGFAAALALADPDIEVECITTVHGNTNVETATRLTELLLGLLGHTEVPVFPGAFEALGPDWPHMPDPTPAATAMARRVTAAPSALTIVTIGPLTNLATALVIEPRVASMVEEVIVMGGVYLEQTNVAAMPGERNFWTDPWAANAVLNSGAPLRLVGLDVTRQVRLTRTDTTAMAASGKAFATYAASLTDDWIAYQQRTRGIPEDEGCAVNDPLAVAAVTLPDLMTWTPAHVAVESASTLTRGVAVADLLRCDDAPTPNCQIASAVDVDRFREHFLTQIERLP